VEGPKKAGKKTPKCSWDETKLVKRALTAYCDSRSAARVSPSWSGRRFQS